MLQVANLLMIPVGPNIPKSGHLSFLAHLAARCLECDISDLVFVDGMARYQFVNVRIVSSSSVSLILNFIPSLNLTKINRT